MGFVSLPDHVAPAHFVLFQAMCCSTPAQLFPQTIINLLRVQTSLYAYSSVLCLRTVTSVPSSFPCFALRRIKKSAIQILRTKHSFLDCEPLSSTSRSSHADDHFLQLLPSYLPSLFSLQFDSSSNHASKEDDGPQQRGQPQRSRAHMDASGSPHSSPHTWTKGSS